MNESAQKTGEACLTGAIFFAGQYGSTAQYAGWIGAASNLPVFDSARTDADPESFDFLVLGSSVIVHKLLIRKWLKRHRNTIENKPVILFTVSGAPAGPKLDGWIADSLPADLTARVHHVALRGKLDHEKIGWWVKLILRIGALMNDDPEAREEELKGFDYMDKSSIAPVLELIAQCRSNGSAPDTREQGEKGCSNERLR